MKNWEKLAEILKNNENSNLELKEAKSEFPYRRLKDYCSALANEGGGFLVLGVDDFGIPVGTSAYPIHDNIQQRLFAELGIRVIIEEYEKDNLRVLVFNIPRYT